MIVIPAIDLRGGKVVRLTHGDPAAQTDYAGDPVTLAKRYADAGAQMLHVVDLDAALGDGSNRSVVEAMCKAVSIPVQTGGGLRSMEAIGEVLEAGAERAVLGTSAVLNPELVEEAVDTLSSRIVVALDVKGNEVMVNGWKDDVGPLEDFIPALTEVHVPRFLITQINVDGTMEGPDLALYRRVGELTDKPVIASGGVHTIEDLRELPATGVESVVVGKALLEGTVALEEALAL